MLYVCKIFRPRSNLMQPIMGFHALTARSSPIATPVHLAAFGSVTMSGREESGCESALPRTMENLDGPAGTARDRQVRKRTTRGQAWRAALAVSEAMADLDDKCPPVASLVQKAENGTFLREKLGLLELPLLSENAKGLILGTLADFSEAATKIAGDIRGLLLMHTPTLDLEEDGTVADEDENEEVSCSESEASDIEKCFADIPLGAETEEEARDIDQCFVDTPLCPVAEEDFVTVFELKRHCNRRQRI